MALPPKFAAHRLVFGTPAAIVASVPPARHTIEVYLDYCCPFSGKIVKTLNGTVFPMIKANDKWASGVEFIFRQQIQPWHPSSTLMHEAALAVALAEPTKFWAYSTELFDQQKDYFDVNVVNETRIATYKRLAKVAVKVGVDEAKLMDMLMVPDQPSEDGSLNVGNKVTNEMKVVTKMNRLIGVHVTPTVVVDGVVQDVSSSWGEAEWKEFLGKIVV